MPELMDQEKEKQVIGTVFHDPSMYPKLALKPEQFGFIRLAALWEFAGRLYEKTGSIDELMLIDHMLSQPSPQKGFKNALDFVGGNAFIVGLSAFFDLNDFRTRAMIYADELRALHVRRQIVNAGVKVQRIARDTDSDIHEVKTKVKRELDSATRGAVGREPNISELVNESDNYVMGEGEPGLEWFLACLRQHLGVLLPGDFFVPAGRMKTGKTRLKACQALYSLKRGKRVAIFTTEMRPIQFVWLLIELQSKTGLTITGLRNRTFKNNPAQFMEYTELSEQLRTYRDDEKLHIVAAQNHTAEMVYERIMQDDPGYWDLIIPDYIQRLAKSPGKWSSPNEEMSNRPKVLKNLALDAETVVMSASQLNRDAINHKTPTAANAAGTDEIGREADYFMSIERNPDSDNPNIAKLHILEARFAPAVSNLKVYFHPKTGSFHDMAIGDENGQNEILARTGTTPVRG